MWREEIWYERASHLGGICPAFEKGEFCARISGALIPGFPDSSVGKESACNVGEPGSIPGSGRSPGEGIGHPLQYSWASLVAQLVKNPPAMQETWVWSLVCEDILEEGKATHSSILAWEFHGLDRPRHHKELDTTETFTSYHFSLIRLVLPTVKSSFKRLQMVIIVL